MKKFLVLFLVVLLFFCSKKEKQQQIKSIVPKVVNVNKVNCKEMVKLDHYRFISANNSISPIIEFIKNTDAKKDDKFYVRNRPDTLLSNYNIKVKVDTSYIIAAKGFQYKDLQYPKTVIVDGLINGKILNKNQIKTHEKEFMKYYNDRFKQWDDYVESYRLIILNEDKDTILTKFKYIQEAKDKNGKWKPLECYYNFGGCGNPESYFFKLIPNNFMVYPIMKYNGNFKTKIRIKLFNAGNVYYSNEFSGQINHSQFDTNNFQKMFMKENPNYNFNEVSNIFFLNK
jgi:hypothetical protein